MRWLLGCGGGGIHLNFEFKDKWQVFCAWVDIWLAYFCFVLPNNGLQTKFEVLCGGASSWPCSSESPWYDSGLRGASSPRITRPNRPSWVHTSFTSLLIYVCLFGLLITWSRTQREREPALAFFFCFCFFLLPYKYSLLVPYPCLLRRRVSVCL